jgi:hypothetical protein
VLLEERVVYGIERDIVGIDAWWRAAEKLTGRTFGTTPHA